MTAALLLLTAAVFVFGLAVHASKRGDEYDGPDEPWLDIDDGWLETLPYLTGTGQELGNVHDELSCSGEHCVVHNPSDHRISDFPTHWRDDRGIMERICPHGVGHPDPDDVAHIARMYGKDRARTESVHGCDGCCAGAFPTPTRQQLIDEHEDGPWPG